jgi:hypothetical protein
VRPEQPKPTVGACGMTTVLESTELPEYLRHDGAFSLHLTEQLADQPNHEKGAAFTAFACRVLPLCDFWKEFTEPVPSIKKTHDKGIDFDARVRTTDAPIVGQAKLHIREVDEFDSILSKFAAWERAALEDQGTGRNLSLFKDNSGSSGLGSCHFIIITSSNLERIRLRYETGRLPSLEFYRRIMKDGRLHVIDGPRLLLVLQSLYRQSYLIAPELELQLHAGFLRQHNVFLSILTARTLRALHAQYGNSLFFENIRDFLGISGDHSEKGREHDVNDAILDTLQNHPAKMLGRNNGITFRADDVAVISDKMLRLVRGSIVNGCQTTMCAVNASNLADDAMIAVKVVVGDDSWEVAKSANYQNRVARIDLEIARFLRPQVVRKIAISLKYGVDASSMNGSISDVLEDIHRTRISYDAVKFLYLGIFSRHPNNLFNENYSELRLDVLEAIDKIGKGQHEHVMSVLFQLWVCSERASDALRMKYESKKSSAEILDTFKRFFEKDKVRYHCLLAILAAAGCVDDDLMDKSPNSEDAGRKISRFIDKLQIVLSHHRDYFNRVYAHAFGVVADRVLQQVQGDLADLLQSMFKDVKSMSGAPFKKLHMALRIRMNNDDGIVEPDFGSMLSEA